MTLCVKVFMVHAFTQNVMSYMIKIRESVCTCRLWYKKYFTRRHFHFYSIFLAPSTPLRHVHVQSISMSMSMSMHFFLTIIQQKGRYCNM